MALFISKVSGVLRILTFRDDAVAMHSFQLHFKQKLHTPCPVLDVSASHLLKL